MITPLCPNCGGDGRWLEHASKHAYVRHVDVDYYRCDCGHVWKFSPSRASELHHVTALELRPSLE